MMLAPRQAEELALQKKKARRTLGQGRRWYLRGVLMFMIAVAAAYNGGSAFYALGIAMVVLAALAFSLGRSMRKSAKSSLEKIELMEQSRQAELRGNGEA